MDADLASGDESRSLGRTVEWGDLGMGRSGELFGFVKRRASLGALQIRRAGWVGLPSVAWG